VKTHSPIIFWLLAAATLAVDAVAFVWLTVAGPLSNAAFLFDALLTAQLAVLCTWCVFGKRRTFSAWAAAIFGGAAASWLEGAALNVGHFEWFGLHGAFVALLIAVLWVLKHSPIWERITGAPTRTWQFSVLQLMAAMTVVALLITILRRSELLSATPELWRWIAIMSVSDVVLVTTTILAWAWGTNRKSDQGHWATRLGAALVVALALGGIELYLMKLGILGLDAATKDQNHIAGMFAYLVIQAFVIFTWLELAPIVDLEDRSKSDASPDF